MFFSSIPSVCWHTLTKMPLLVTARCLASVHTVHFRLGQNKKRKLGIQRHFLSNTSTDNMTTTAPASAHDAGNIFAQFIVHRQENQLLPLYGQVTLYKKYTRVLSRHDSCTSVQLQPQASALLRNLDTSCGVDIQTCLTQNTVRYMKNCSTLGQ